MEKNRNVAPSNATGPDYREPSGQAVARGPVGYGSAGILDNLQFDRIHHLALHLAGIELLERHRELLQRRCHRIGIQSPARLNALLDAVEAGELMACRQLIGLVTTKHAGFFRHPWHFDVAVQHALLVVHRRKQVRLWSAAAAAGEEPYSLAMALIEVFGREDAPVFLLATDIDADALAVAEQGQYGERALRALGPARRARFFTETAVGRWGLAPAVRRLVKFCALNLISADWPVDAPLDVIFCRNVLMYLETRHRYAVLERMASLLEPDGLLILDPAEYLGDAEHLFAPGINGVYSRRGAAEAHSELRRTSPLLAERDRL